MFENANDVRDMTAKRTERLFDGLLIADIGIDGMEAGQLRTALHGNVQSALCHKHEQTNCFERHRFTTGVRTGDNNGARALFWVNVNGHDCV